MVEFIYQFFELFATFIEGVLAIFVSTSLAGRKLSIKQNILYGLSMSIIYTILITLLNKWQVFSFTTIAIASYPQQAAFLPSAVHSAVLSSHVPSFPQG